ncbi:MAG: universal stress protein [Alphaproteobacteria bacterium]
MTVLPQTILVATDNSKQSMIAVDYAVELAKMTGAALHVVHVGWLSPWLYPVRLSDQQIKTLESEAQKALDEAVDQVKAGGGAVAGAHLRMGRPDGEVITLAEEIGADLVLVGARGRDSVPRIPLGRDSENIVKHAPCPVLVVRERVEASMTAGAIQVDS